jgi:outer membrane lipoprotein-sorting protein
MTSKSKFMIFGKVVFSSAIILSFLSISGFQGRQDPMAEEILNAVGKKHKKMPGFIAKFSHDSETNSGKVVGNVKGEIKVTGSKYVLTSGQTTLMCDGKTVWSADRKLKEVNISDYEPEPDDITPERIYTFYQKGFKYIFMGEVKVKGKIWQTIDLEPENIKKEVVKIRLFIDKSSRNIMKWIVFERGSNDREVFEIEEFKVLQTVNNSDFTFNKKQFPGFKVVDLR